MNHLLSSHLQQLHLLPKPAWIPGAPPQTHYRSLLSAYAARHWCSRSRNTVL